VYQGYTLELWTLAKAAAEHVWRCDRRDVSCRLLCDTYCVINSITSHTLFLFPELFSPLQVRLGEVLSYFYNSNSFIISFIKR